MLILAGECASDVAARIGDRPPERMLTAVRAIAPVAGMPPKNPEATDASPCPTSSRSASYGPVSDIEAATRADSSDSIAANAATVNAGPSSDRTVAQSAVGRRGAGRVFGSSPIVAAGR